MTSRWSERRKETSQLPATTVCSTASVSGECEKLVIAIVVAPAVRALSSPLVNVLVACVLGGLGQLLLAAGGTASVLLTLTGLRFLRERGLRQLLDRSQAITVSYRRGHGTMAPLIDAIERVGAEIERLAIEDDEELRTVALRVRAARPELLADELRVVADLPEVEGLEFA